MAIDSQEKRMAAASTARPWMRATYPTGTIDAAERASAGNTYGGNAFEAVYVWVLRGGTYTYVAANNVGRSMYFEVDFLATAGTVYAHLYDLDDAAAVADSEQSTAETTLQTKRSDALTLADGHVYRLRLGKFGADAGEGWGAKVLGI